MVKVILSFEKKHLGFLLLGIGIFVFAGFVWAYNPTMSGGNPVAFGHSADELHVNIDGTIKSLQQAIDDDDFGGAPTGDPGVQPWQEVTGGISYTSGNVGIGTNAPSGLLHLDSSTNGKYVFTGSGGGGYQTTFSMSGTGLAIGHDSGTRNLALRTNNADRLIIGGNGDVSIPGITTFGGFATFQGSGGDAVFNLLDTSGQRFSFREGGVERFSIDGDTGTPIYNPAAFDISTSLGSLVLGTSSTNTCANVCAAHGLGCNILYELVTQNILQCDAPAQGGYRLCFCH